MQVFLSEKQRFKLLCSLYKQRKLIQLQKGACHVQRDTENGKTHPSKTINPQNKGVLVAV